MLWWHCHWMWELDKVSYFANRQMTIGTPLPWLIRIGGARPIIKWRTIPKSTSPAESGRGEFPFTFLFPIGHEITWKERSISGQKGGSHFVLASRINRDQRSQEQSSYIRRGETQSVWKAFFVLSEWPQNHHPGGQTVKYTFFVINSMDKETCKCMRFHKIVLRYILLREIYFLGPWFVLKNCRRIHLVVFRDMYI